MKNQPILARFLVLSFLIYVSGCTKSAVEPTRQATSQKGENNIIDDPVLTQITGLVLESDTIPVHNAKVTVLSTGFSVYTATNGGYSLLVAAPATYTLQYSKTGYGTQNKSVTVQSGIPVGMPHVILVKNP